MKKILLSLTLLMLSVVMYAQNEVTKFLGIPIDGTKADMIQKLKAKGFTYNAQIGLLEGTFNGENVYILKSATKPLKVLIAFTRPLITEFADNLNLKHPLLPTISPYPTM